MIDPAFFKHLTGEDELGVVIRAHIHIEASINEFIEAVIPLPHHLPRLPYEGRLRLACAIGLDYSHFKALKLLGDIRNAFGHKVDAKLTEEKLNELYALLPPDIQSLVLEAYNMTKQSSNATVPPFMSLSPKDRFVIIAATLKPFVVAEVLKAKNASKESNAEDSQS